MCTYGTCLRHVVDVSWTCPATGTTCTLRCCVGAARKTLNPTPASYREGSGKAQGRLWEGSGKAPSPPRPRGATCGWRTAARRTAPDACTRLRGRSACARSRRSLGRRRRPPSPRRGAATCRPARAVSCSEQRVSTRGANALDTAEYGRMQRSPRPLERWSECLRVRLPLLGVRDMGRYGGRYGEISRF